jgi:curli biogenesis system outer membrane secretion channel CsgG
MILPQQRIAFPVTFSVVAERAKTRTTSGLQRVFMLAALAMTLASCQSLNSKVKPGAIPPSEFLDHASAMKAEPHRSPFRLNWTNPSASAYASLKKKKEITIANVTLDHLRPMSKTLANVESGEQSHQEACTKLSTYAREAFSNAFHHSKTPRFQLVDRASKDSLTLELAIVDLNPNSISGAVIRAGVNAVAVPGTDLILAKAARPLKGNIAIEGRLRDSRTHEVIYEFADNEESKSAVFINLRDFTPYGQARLAIREWAEQFEQLLRTPLGGQVKDSSSVTFRLW